MSPISVDYGNSHPLQLELFAPADSSAIRKAQIRRRALMNPTQYRSDEERLRRMPQ
jgi:hypothetical protein